MWLNILGRQLISVENSNVSMTSFIIHDVYHIIVIQRVIYDCLTTSRSLLSFS